MQKACSLATWTVAAVNNVHQKHNSTSEAGNKLLLHNARLAIICTAAFS
jgi:hypothetical protein